MRSSGTAGLACWINGKEEERRGGEGSTFAADAFPELSREDGLVGVVLCIIH